MADNECCFAWILRVVCGTHGTDKRRPKGLGLTYIIGIKDGDQVVLPVFIRDRCCFHAVSSV